MGVFSLFCGCSLFDLLTWVSKVFFFSQVKSFFEGGLHIINNRRQKCAYTLTSITSEGEKDPLLVLVVPPLSLNTHTSARTHTNTESDTAQHFSPPQMMQLYGKVLLMAQQNILKGHLYSGKSPEWHTAADSSTQEVVAVVRAGFKFVKVIDLMDIVNLMNHKKQCG